MRHRKPRRGFVVVAGSVVIVLVIGLALARLVALEPGPGSTSPAHADVVQTFHICPIADCTRYPDPPNVRGITISALQSWLPQQYLIYKQISAMAAWNANAMRLQILQDKLVGADGKSFSQQYMGVVEKFIRYALHKHLTVIIAAQTELSVGYTKNESLPTAATAAFWDRFIPKYGRNPHVVFDLFNEPRKCSWQQWSDTMQPLVEHVRRAGSINQLWIEGVWWASTLEGVPMLRGQGLVYSFHHPGSPWPWQAPVNRDTWQRSFGYLADRGVPVVDGEFTNYIGGYYWAHATRTVTEYLRYLRAHKIGLVAWSLASGVMSSIDYSHAISEPQADGRLVQRYFWGSL